VTAFITAATHASILPASLQSIAGAVEQAIPDSGGDNLVVMTSTEPFATCQGTEFMGVSSRAYLEAMVEPGFEKLEEVAIRGHNVAQSLGVSPGDPWLGLNARKQSPRLIVGNLNDEVAKLVPRREMRDGTFVMRSDESRLLSVCWEVSTTSPRGEFAGRWLTADDLFAISKAAEKEFGGRPRELGATAYRRLDQSEREGMRKVRERMTEVIVTSLGLSISGEFLEGLLELAVECFIRAASVADAIEKITRAIKSISAREESR
jgi:hypothetical protein